MKQLVQSVKSGELRLVDSPLPQIDATEVLVRTHRSVVSAGTERAVRQLASANLLQKAKARPDLVKQVINKARTEGLKATANAVQSRLDDEMPLGYSAVGTVVEVGSAVEGITPGQRVATGGAGHGDFQTVSGLLAVPVPDGVSDTDAAFATVGAIAMQGIRQAEVGPGARICVIGLGLLGQITCRLAQASGLLVSGIDLQDWTVAKALDGGVEAFLEAGADTTEAIRSWTKGRGVDAVIITAATKSSDPVIRATEITRDRAPIVVVGDVGLEIDRRPFYEQELTLKFARSYGPGRYERSYEDWAVDYPIGYVRWTEGRNLEAVLDLLAARSVSFEDLVTHDFEFTDADKAYEVIEGGSGPFFGVQLSYDDVESEPSRTIRVDDKPLRGNIGIIGAGTFVRSTLLRAIREARIGEVRTICSASGSSARFLAEKEGIPQATTSASAVINDPEIDLVVIASPHSTHADLVCETLAAGKDVFCEKPLAITEDELDRVEAALDASEGSLRIGFNRRHSPAIRQARGIFGDSGGPLTMIYRVNAGNLPASHWYHDRREGGRLIGEVCHFIDTCNAMVGDLDAKVSAVGSGAADANEDYVVTLRYADGSLATIAYACNGHASMAKEHFEILGRGHAVTIDDYRSITIDGKTTKLDGDKGHVAQFSTQTDVQSAGQLRTSRTALAFLECMGR